MDNQKLNEQQRISRIILTEIATSIVYKKRYEQRIGLSPDFPQHLCDEQVFGFECSKRVMINCYCKIFGEKHQDIENAAMELAKTLPAAEGLRF